MNARATKPGPGEAQSMAAPSEAAGQDAPTPTAKKSRKKRLGLMLSVPLVVALGGGYLWLSGAGKVETDNAYVQQPKVSISADVAGRVVGVAVHDNQQVAAGAVLFTIDPEPYRIALDQAEAALASARVNVEQLRVAHGTAGARLAAAQETLALRKAELDRKESLLKEGLAADATLDDVRLAYQTAQTNVALGQQELASAVAALGGDPAVATDDHPTVRTAIAAVENARRNLDKTIVVAPGDGVISQVASLNVGQFVAIGTTIATLVETGNTWVAANFKETQLADLVPGMPAEVSVDAFPGVTFSGHVDSIGAATGAEFALIPAQNASGNWVKITQRVPVRIAIDGAGDSLLRAGMSAVVTVVTKAAS